MILACSSSMIIRAIYFKLLLPGFIYRVYLGFPFPAPMVFFPQSQAEPAGSSGCTYLGAREPPFYYSLSPTCNYSYLLKATAPHVS